MQILANMYRPITAAPFLHSSSYCEITPCKPLLPFIRCFWGTSGSGILSEKGASPDLVIPDTCMDIIFHINGEQKRCEGFLCAIDEGSYRGRGYEEKGEVFAVRFYAWSAVLFAERDFSGTKNRAFAVEEFFSRLKSELEPQLIETAALSERVAAAEKALLKTLCPDRINADLANAVYYMLKTNGKAKVSEICAYTAVSERQLERVFNYSMGVSAKAFSLLLRYQLLWQDIALSPQFSILDAVEKFGYTDQSHLLKDFRKRHMMTPKEAVEYAQKLR